MASSGNFCTWNPLDPIDSNITLSDVIIIIDITALT